MKIDRTYFKGDLFVPAMKPSVTDTGNTNELDGFIETYGNECILKCFGYTLAELVIANTETDSMNAKSDAEQKWKDLIDGEIVTFADGSKRRWKGLAYKSNNTDENKSMSLLANYIYFFYERSNYVAKSTTGDQKPDAFNATAVNAGYKTSIAWNKFVDEVVGVGYNSDGKVIETDFGYGIDWYSAIKDFSLYEYIKYKNDLVSDTYPFFQPTYFRKINELGI